MVIEPVSDFFFWYMDRTEKPFLISVKNSQKPFLSGTLPVRNPSYIRNPPSTLALPECHTFVCIGTLYSMLFVRGAGADTSCMKEKYFDGLTQEYLYCMCFRWEVRILIALSDARFNSNRGSK